MANRLINYFCSLVSLKIIWIRKKQNEIQRLNSGEEKRKEVMAIYKIVFRSIVCSSLRVGHLGQCAELLGRNVESILIFGQFSSQRNIYSPTSHFAEHQDDIGMRKALHFASVDGYDFITYSKKKKKKKRKQMKIRD